MTERHPRPFQQRPRPLREIAQSRVFYKLFHPILSAAAKLNDHIEIQKNYRQHLDFKAYSERTASIVTPSKNVLSGPFRDLRYPSFQACGSALLPKLLGIYESELHPTIQSLPGPYDYILDIGCAEGYYAVGLARLHPRAIVYAFDIDAKALQITEEMASLNGVSHRLVLHGAASWKDLELVKNKRSLVICDCEGHERLLFSHLNISSLGDSDLIIELHPVVWEDIADFLMSLFSQTHTCELVTAIPDQEKDLAFDAISHLPLDDRKLCVAEFRGNFQQWLVCRSQHNGH